MAYKICGSPAFKEPLINRQATMYYGIDGIYYRIQERKTVSVNNSLFFNASNVPYIESEWISGGGSIQGIGVILDSNGAEVLRFYPANLITPASQANRKAITQPKNPPAFPNGQYQIVTFDPFSSTIGTMGTGQICIGGLPVTPTPTPTITPT